MIDLHSLTSELEREGFAPTYVSILQSIIARSGARTVVQMSPGQLARTITAAARARLTTAPFVASEEDAADVLALLARLLVEGDAASGRKSEQVSKKPRKKAKRHTAKPVRSSTVVRAPIRSRAGFGQTTLAGVLGKDSVRLRDSNIDSISSLRRIAGNAEALSACGFNKQEVGALSGFANIARVFPVDAAIALQEAGLTRLVELESWDVDRFGAALADGGLEARAIEMQVSRFERLKSAAARGQLDEDVTGIALDLYPHKLKAGDRKALQKASVETVSDWARNRTEAAVSPETRGLLDGLARLSGTGVTGRDAQALMAAGYNSAIGLAGAGTDELNKLSDETGMDSARMASVQSQSQVTSSELFALLNDTLRYGDDTLPESLIAKMPIAGIRRKCVPCPPELSVFSCFAYYIYLVQLTGKNLGVLESELGLSLRTLSPEDMKRLDDNPTPPCEEKTLCETVTWALQDYLEKLQSQASMQEERESFEFLSFDAWRADRMAYYFPELNALWRDDVLTGEDGPWDRGSIVRDRTALMPRLRAQIEQVRSALDSARVSTHGSANGFRNNPDRVDDDTRARDFDSTLFANDFQRGISAIEDVLNADDEVMEAIKHLDEDQPGLSIASLYDALGHLDALAERVFFPASPWNDLQTSSPRFEDLIGLPAAERRQELQRLRDELHFEPKLIYSSSIDSLQQLLDADLRDGRVQDYDAWILGRFRGFDSQSDAPGDIGKILKDRRPTNPQTVRSCRYRPGTSMQDYTIEVTVNARDMHVPVHGLPSGELFGVLFRTLDSNNTYRIVVRSENVDPGGGIALRHFVVLQKVEGGSITELGRDTSSINVEAGSTYKFTVWVNTDNGQSTLSCRVHPTGIGSDKTVEVVDNTFTQGTFGFAASNTIEAAFGSMSVVVRSAQGQIGPPFYSVSRHGFGHVITGEYFLSRRDDQAVGMATSLPDYLTFESEGVTATRLMGVVGDRFLLFRDGETAVDTSALDVLLDYCIALSFYLRFAVIPTRLAQAFLHSGEFSRAIDMLHVIYDDTVVGGEAARRIYPYLASPPELLTMSIGADVRLLKIRLAEVYLAWADWLFRKDARENPAAARRAARKYYTRVLQLWSYQCGCESRIGEVVEELLDRYRVWITGRPTAGDLAIASGLLGLIGEVTSRWSAMPLDHDGAHSLIRESPDVNRGGDAGRERARDAMQSLLKNVRDHYESEETRYAAHVRKDANVSALFTSGQEVVKEAELLALAYGGFDPLAGSGFRAGSYAGVLGGVRTGIGDPPAIWLYRTIQYTLCVPPNPVVSSQVLHACSMIELIDNCRNVLGFTDDIVPPLRFEALLRVARNFTDLARASERDLLGFRQSFEQESFSLLQASMNLALSTADVDLEALSVELARGEIDLALIQQFQSEHSVAHFDGLINAGLSSMEQLALGSAVTSAVFSGVAALPALASAGVAAFGLAKMGTGIFASAGAATTAAGLLGTVASGPQSIAGFASSVSQAASMQANYERREQEWRYTRQQSQFAVAIAQNNVALSTTRLRMAETRRRIAELRMSLSRDAVQFLSHKFLNSAMWVFMQRTIREQYRIRLNYAITTSFMAERALAFELQSRSLRVVRFDYFDPQRDGLLGATQLETDLATLENAKFNYTKRKLQLKKTVSLAQVMPAEFEQFKAGPGQLLFSTLLEWFDRDFPGHYMRLIKNVSVTVIALVPPQDGIRAELRNTGVSKVVVGPPYSDVFEERAVRREPASIALAAPFQQTGLFVLDYDDDLLLPFEGLGVETDWQFVMPKAANGFDYKTLADVLVTIEYTALSDDHYQEEVVDRLSGDTEMDRALSMRYHFADQWYHLHNPEQSTTPMNVSFETGTNDFPPNVSQLKIKEIVLYVVAAEGVSFQESVTLTFQQSGASTAVGGAETASSGVISTRQAGAPNWVPMKDKHPAGVWSLTLPDTSAVRKLFADGKIDDILLVVTISGKSAAWPQ